MICSLSLGLRAVHAEGRGSVAFWRWRGGARVALRATVVFPAAGRRRSFDFLGSNLADGKTLGTRLQISEQRTLFLGLSAANREQQAHVQLTCGLTDRAVATGRRAAAGGACWRWCGGGRVALRLTLEFPAAGRRRRLGFFSPT